MRYSHVIAERDVLVGGRHSQDMLSSSPPHDISSSSSASFELLEDPESHAETTSTTTRHFTQGIRGSRMDAFSKYEIIFMALSLVAVTAISITAVLVTVIETQL